MTRRALLLALMLAAAAVTPAAAQFSDESEQRNYSKTRERAREYGAPGYQAELRRRSAEQEAQTILLRASDPERNFHNLCSTHNDGCAGDVRFYDWERNGHGIVRPVLFTARNGATLSGHVWATRSGPSYRPGIVITNGSVQAPEQLYWFAAANLAKRGYVVFTWDPQGQGRSDVFGEGADRFEGVPSQAGRPFYDNTEDALDFFFSTAHDRFKPRRSCSTGTDHSAKQNRRVAENRNASHNPLWRMLDPSRVGVAGHSFGAAGVSFVGQADPRVDAIVAWDNLGGTARAEGAPECPSAPATRRSPAITKPALGMSNDYGLTPTPYREAPDPDGANAASLEYSKNLSETAQLNIRGGTHYEYSYIPNPAFGATLRGMDLVAWYTAAWFDKYVKRDNVSSDSRLLTDRWHNDRPGAQVDPGGDGNLFSSYLRSRIDIRLAGGRRYVCENVRSGDCGLRPDCEEVPFSYLRLGLSADRPRSDRPCSVRRLRCVGRRAGVTRHRIGPARYRGRYTRFARRYRAVRRGRRVTRFCVRGGGRFLVAARRGRISFVASTARRHRARRMGPGRRVRDGRIAGTRRLSRRLYVGRRGARSRVVYGVRGGKVRFVAVVARREARSRRLLVRRLRSAGLLRRR